MFASLCISPNYLFRFLQGTDPAVVVTEDKDYNVINFDIKNNSINQIPWIFGIIVGNTASINLKFNSYIHSSNISDSNIYLSTLCDVSEYKDYNIGSMILPEIYLDNKGKFEFYQKIIGLSDVVFIILENSIIDQNKYINQYNTSKCCIIVHIPESNEREIITTFDLKQNSNDDTYLYRDKHNRIHCFFYPKSNYLKTSIFSYLRQLHPKKGLYNRLNTNNSLTTKNNIISVYENKIIKLNLKSTEYIKNTILYIDIECDKQYSIDAIEKHITDKECFLILSGINTKTKRNIEIKTKIQKDNYQTYIHNCINLIHFLIPKNDIHIHIQIPQSKDEQIEI